MDIFSKPERVWQRLDKRYVGLRLLDVRLRKWMIDLKLKQPITKIEAL
jgi:hypothetical protein